MSEKVKVNPLGGKCIWKIAVSNLMLGVYRGLLMDNNNKVIQSWRDQNTIDDTPDEFQIESSPAELEGYILWFNCIVSDPSYLGGPYTCSLTIMQDNKVIYEDDIASVVPHGKGKLDIVADQVTFTNS